MKTKVCTCEQCRATKKRKSTNTRKAAKRQVSKWRRKAKEGEVLNFYWA